jgi:hypothetical protein
MVKSWYRAGDEKRDKPGYGQGDIPASIKELIGYPFLMIIIDTSL